MLILLVLVIIMKNILNDGRDISIAKLVENTSLIIK